MHREYHPEDMQHLHAHAFGDDHDHHHASHHAHGHDHRGLFAFTVLLGVLIGIDLILWQAGANEYRQPFGVSLILVAALLGGAKIVYGALEALAQGRVGADIALAQAAVAAIVIGEYFVAAEVVFIALVGECLEAITADRAMRAIGRLFEQTPRTARVRRDGVEIDVAIREVVAGDIVIVAAGEKVAVDGEVLTGRSSVDQAALTGESIPIDKGPGEPVYAGTLNQFGRLEVRADRVGRDTTLGQVLRLVADAQRRKAPLHRAADRYARWFLPVVQVAAGVTLLTGYLLGWPDVWHRTVAVLVVACPCALVLATPAAIMASMAWLARHGVVIKGGAALERLARCDTLAFDKTGTLTEGRPEPSSVMALGGWSDAEVLRYASAAESSSRHPLAEVVRRAADDLGVVALAASEVVTQPGAGVAATVLDSGDGEPRDVLVGNRRLLEERGVALDEAAISALAEFDERGETSLVVAVDRSVVGLIGARDALRPEAHDVVHDLKHLGFTEIAILTGDRPAAAKAVAKRTHIKRVEAELLPADKASWVREHQAEGRRVAMIGDGINDAPALAVADVGIALGRVGADLAAEAGDMVLLGEPLHVLPDLVRLSRKTVAILRQNILGFAFGLNAVAFVAAFLGVLGPVAAAILHQAGSLLVLLNSMRLLAFGDWGNLKPVRGLRLVGSVIRRMDDAIDPGLLLDAILARWRALALLVLGGTAMYLATRGWVAIAPHEVGLVQRHGRFLEALGPGLHLRLPPPFETVTRLEPARVRGVEIGFRAVAPESATDVGRWESRHSRGTIARGEEEALVLTGDGRLVELAATVQYRLNRDVGALRNFAFRAADAESSLRPLAESCVRSVVGRMPFEDLLTDGRREAELTSLESIQQRVDDYQLGLEIVAVAFQEVHPPLAVLGAFRETSRAESEKQTRVNEGETYLAERLTLAAGAAAVAVNTGAADREVRVRRSKGEAESFDLRRQARATAPSMTDQRLYVDILASSLTGRDKLLLDSSQAGTRRHLVLPASPSAEAAAILVPADRDPGGAN